MNHIENYAGKCYQTSRQKHLEYAGVEFKQSTDEIEVLQGVWGTEHPNGSFCNECTQKQVSKSLCGDCQHDFDFVHRE